MASNDAMNKLIRGANASRTWEVDETPPSAGRDWLRGEVEEAKLRGTAAGNPPAELPPVVTPPVVSHGSADGGAGLHSAAGPSMNEYIRSSADASRAAIGRDRAALARERGR